VPQADVFTLDLDMLIPALVKRQNWMRRCVRNRPEPESTLVVSEALATHVKASLRRVMP